MAQVDQDPDTEKDLQRGRKGADSARLSDCLLRVFDCEVPLKRPARYRLDGVRKISLRRASADSATFVPSGEERGLDVGIPDRWVSSEHANLTRVLDGWVFEDRGSRNGTFVNGRPVKSVQVFDGDLLEVGHTLFLLREQQPVDPARPAIEHDALADAIDPRLATLVPELSHAFLKVSLLAPSTVSVVVRGETGTGKELVASTLHELSRRPGAFVAVNCAALVPTLVESELFGYRRGAFSGALEDRIGLIRAADKGTLFLDEIGDLPLLAQAALLRVLQEGEVLPVGGTKPFKVDLRLVCATHRDLAAMSLAERFRPDLLARISGAIFELPPLRERREDLALLLPSVLQKHLGAAAAQVRFTCDAARALFAHDWPFNVRELEKTVQTALVLSAGAPIDLTHLPAPVVSAAPELDDEDSKRREQLIALLQEKRGNVAAVARVMGRARMQIHRWISRYRIELDTFRR